MALHQTFKRGLLAAFWIAAALCAAVASAEPLRVCADPDNLPFSKSDGPEKGLYVELAELVGQRLGMEVQYVWWLSYNQRKALRNTILQDGCDAYFALPADAEYRVRGLTKTRSFLTLSYALVAPAGLQIKGVDDLKNKRVAVLHGTPPHILLASKQGFETRSFLAQGEVFDALDKGLVDVALLWGPSAGYENQKQQANRWRVTPLEGEGFGGKVAVAVPLAKADLAARIDKALADLQAQIQTLSLKYGFPGAAPILLAARATPTPAHGRAVAAAVAPPKGFMRTGASGTWLVAQADAQPDIAQGQSIFNNTCSHCHGSNGASPISERDLRKLQRRYKDDWRDTALTTIKNGRPTLGMPTWKDSFSTEQIDSILAFLGTIQR